MIAILLAIVAVMIVWEPNHDEEFNPQNPLINFRCGEQRISSWYDENTYYLFLPSYATLSDVTAEVMETDKIAIDGAPLTPNTDFSKFCVGQDYPMNIEGSADGVYQFKILQSANVPTMFVETQSGSMKRIFKDKEYKEAAQITLYTEDGAIDYYSKSGDAISGRGNSSWSLSSKKPFNLYLTISSPLLGMASAENWALLANAQDPSNLRNKIVFSFAQKVRAYPGWVPQGQFVDLYLNGEYAGLYLLNEKIEVTESRLNLSENESLLEIQLNWQLPKKSISFAVNDSLSAEIHYPKECSEEHLNTLKNQFLSFQEALLSEDGMNKEGRRWDEYIDLDSWARKYLIDEIFMNIDAQVASDYWIFNQTDQCFYAGPCWDYDRTFERDPESFYAQEFYHAKGRYTPWYGTLWEKPEFRKKAIDLYQSEFLPSVKELINSGIANASKEITAVSNMNAVRWGRKSDEQEYEAKQLTDFLSKRSAFLNSAWIEGDLYCTVDVAPVYWYYYYAVRKGDSANIPTPEELGMRKGAIWYREDTMEPFDASEPVTEDITLFVPTEDVVLFGLHTRSPFLIYIRDNTGVSIFVGLFVVFLLCFICVDHKTNRRKRKRGKQ